MGFKVLQAEPRGDGYYFRATQLLEISSVAIPSCPTCMVTGKTTKENRSMHNTKDEIVFTLLDDEPTFDIDPSQLAGTLGQLIVHEARNATRKALNHVMGKLDDGDDDIQIVKSADSSDLATIDGLFMSAAAGFRVAVEAAQRWLQANEPRSTLNNDDLEKLGRLVDASLQQLGHQEEAAAQIRRIMRGEVAARSAPGFRHLTPGQMINYRNDWNQRAERDKARVPAY
jgi:hypothetical protein